MAEVKTYHLTLVAKAYVRSSIEVKAASLAEAVEKLKTELDTGDEPGVQPVSDVTWRYDGLADDYPIRIRL